MRRAIISGKGSIVINPYNDFYCAGRHTHDRLEIKYIISGEGTHVINGDSMPARTGDIFVIGLSSSHYIECQKTNPVMAYNLNVGPDALEEALGKNADFKKKLSDSPYIRVQDTQGYVRGIMEEMHSEYVSCKPGYMELLRGDLLLILVYIFRNAGEKQEDVKKSQDPIFNVVSYIDKHFEETVTLETLADFAGYNATYLSRRFKQVMGVGINEYIHKIRVNRACVYLRESERSFAEIAYRVGYEDENFFRSVFRRTVGKNPREYRSECKRMKLEAESN